MLMLKRVLNDCLRYCFRTCLVAWRMLQLMIESTVCHAVPKEIIQMIILLNWTTWHEAMGQRMNDTEFVG